MDKTFAQWPESLWADNAKEWEFERLQSDSSCAVVIVGAGFTGLWTAHHLLNIDPHLDIIIIDAQQPGFGASGRNGGWCSALSPMSLPKVAQQFDTSGAIALQQHLVDTVNQIGQYISHNDIQCGWRHSGTISFARNVFQTDRLIDDIKTYRDFGFGEDFISLLSADEADERIRISDSLAASFTPHCATLHPRQLINGLVDDLLSRGVQFFGNTRAAHIGNNVVQVQTDAGVQVIKCLWSIRATEAYTPHIKSLRRTIAPVYSYMIATEPLSAPMWSAIGWENGETWTDGRHMIVYAQKTQDGRIAFGGRGAPYKFASRIGGSGDNNALIHQKLEETLHQFIPCTNGVPISHRWGGSLGINRDWNVSVEVDHGIHVASAGGYVGDGVAFSYLAAKSLANELLMTDDSSRLLPFVQHISRKWEPEPFRWLGINSMITLAQRADISEEKGKTPSKLATAILRAFTN